MKVACVHIEAILTWVVFPEVCSSNSRWYRPSTMRLGGLPTVKLSHPLPVWSALDSISRGFVGGALGQQRKNELVLSAFACNRPAERRHGQPYTLILYSLTLQLTTPMALRL